MIQGHFYFLKEDYFNDFPDPAIMKNKEKIDGKTHNRPCYYAFRDSSTGLYWVIPISSKIAKFQKVYNSKTKLNGRCDTLVFGDVMGSQKAFLIQNMCPVTDDYIKNEYIDATSSKPVRISPELEKKVNQSAKLVLGLKRRGYKVIFPDVLSIEKKLIENLQNDRSKTNSETVLTLKGDNSDVLDLNKYTNPNKKKPKRP